MNDTITKIEENLDTVRAVAREQQLELRTDDEWNEIVDHIAVHRYLINRTIPWRITWDDAVFSWYENVLTPVLSAVRRWEVRNAFPEMSDGRLYLAVATHWYYLPERDPATTAETAATSFAARYGHGIASWFSRFLNPVR
jgi:hypothetical protein